jgi:hypothetical protein
MDMAFVSDGQSVVIGIQGDGTSMWSTATADGGSPRPVRADDNNRIPRRSSVDGENQLALDVSTDGSSVRMVDVSRLHSDVRSAHGEYLAGLQLRHGNRVVVHPLRPTELTPE